MLPLHHSCTAELEALSSAIGQDEGEKASRSERKKQNYLFPGEVISTWKIQMNLQHTSRINKLFFYKPAMNTVTLKLK